MKAIHTDKAPKAVGPYSQAIVNDGLVFCSGQIGLDPQTQALVEGLEAQTHQVIKNLQAVLEEAGSGLSQIIRTTIYVKDMNDFATVNEIYGSYFSEHKPARATVEVSSLPKGAIIEIDAIAKIK